MISELCNLCGKKLFLNVFQKDGFNIVKCKHCGLVFVNPRLSDEEIARLYLEEDYFKRSKSGTGYRDYRGDEKLHLRTFGNEFDLIEEVKHGGKCLDIGCAAGFSLAIARERGWETFGVELSSHSAGYARETQGLNVFSGTLEDAAYPGDYFDLIISYGTIEHLTDPASFFREVFRILKQDGLFVFSTPDIGTWLGNRKFQYKPAEHLFYFDKDTISKMLHQAGMEVFYFRKMKIFRSVAFLLERLSYYFKAYRLFSSTISFFSEKTRLSRISFFMYDGQMVVHAGKKNNRA